MRAIADVLGGHCRTLRRLEVGPFSVDEADASVIVLGADTALARICGLGPVAMRRLRGEARALTGRRSSGSPVQPRWGRSTASTAATEPSLEAVDPTGLAPTVVTFDPHPRIVLGNKVEQIATIERRLELFAGLGVETTLVAGFTTELMRLEPEEFAESYLRGDRRRRPSPQATDFRFGAKRRGDLELLEQLGFEILAVPEVPGVSSSAIRAAIAAGDMRPPRGCSGGRTSSTASSSPATSAAARSAIRPPTSRSSPT